MSDPNRIVQIVPSSGWLAYFEAKGGGLRSEPLVGWGLDASGNIHALSTDSAGIVERVQDISNFHHIEEPASR